MRPAARRPGRLLLVALSMLIVVAVAGCSDSEPEPEAAPVSNVPNLTAPRPTPTTPGASVTIDPDAPPCGLRSPEFPASAVYCNSLGGIEDGSIVVPAGPEFCLLAATAPPKLVEGDFWGRTEVVTALETYFAELLPLAPPNLNETTAQMAELATQYVALLEQRDAGDITVYEAEVQFQELVAPVEAANPGFLDGWVEEVLIACTPAPS